MSKSRQQIASATIAIIMISWWLTQPWCPAMVALLQLAFHILLPPNTLPFSRSVTYPVYSKLKFIAFHLSGKSLQQ